MGRERYWRKSIEASNKAIGNGSLVPLRTEYSLIKDKFGNELQLRRLIGSVPEHLNQSGPKQNVFKPWDANLQVDTIGDRHVLILNKYPIVKGHMLLITRKWQPQNGWLTVYDWEAMQIVDNDTTGLWFFNNSPKAGASQPHRHLQLLRREVGQINCPREQVFLSTINQNTNHQSKFQTNSLTVKRTLSPNSDPAQDLFDDYCHLCRVIGVGDPISNEKPLKAYNLLITKGWISIILRSREKIKGFSINARGFAGYLLYTNKSDITWLTKHGPDELLDKVI